MSAKKTKEWGGTILCTICQASTTVTERAGAIHEYYTIPCAYCIWLERKSLAEELSRVREQRDALASAIDVARTIKLLEPKP